MRGKSGWLLLGRLNSWAEHGTTLVGNSDEKDTEVGVKFAYQRASCSVCFYLVSNSSNVCFFLAVSYFHSGFFRKQVLKKQAAAAKHRNS